MKAKSYEIDMCNGPLAGKILRFAIPLMLSGILQLLFNAADIIAVSYTHLDVYKRQLITATSCWLIYETGFHNPTSFSPRILHPAGNGLSRIHI